MKLLSHQLFIFLHYYSQIFYINNKDAEHEDTSVANQLILSLLYYRRHKVDLKYISGILYNMINSLALSLL